MNPPHDACGNRSIRRAYDWRAVALALTLRPDDYARVGGRICFLWRTGDRASYVDDTYYELVPALDIADAIAARTGDAIEVRARHTGATLYTVTATGNYTERTDDHEYI